MNEGKRFRARLLAACLAACVGMAAKSAFGQATLPPLVRTTVQIDSHLLSDNLSASDLERVKQELAEYAARKLPRPGFEFMRWKPLQMQPDLPSVAEFRILIKQKSSGGIPRLLLEYQAFVEGKPVDLSGLPVQPIYDGPAPSVHSADRLIEDIKSLRLDRDLANEANRAMLATAFAKHVPLSKSVIVEQGKPDIIVPVDFDSLQASDQSHLYVVFTAQPDERPAEAGSMRLRPVTKIVNGTFQGGVNCRVYTFDFRTVSLAQPGVDDPRVTSILAPTSMKSAQVFMEEFKARSGPLYDNP
jgi:hypothetical protein